MRDQIKNESENKELEAKLLDRYRLASDEIDSITYIGAFIISELSAQCLIDLKKELEDISKEVTWYEYLEEEHDVLNTCIRDMRKIAKNDLKVK